MTTDARATDWLTGSDLPWQRLVTFGPHGFEAYARLRQLPDPDRPGLAEGDAGVAEDRPTDREQALTALTVLRGHTSTPDDLYVCMWEGWGSDLTGPRVELPHRSYVLLREVPSEFMRLGLVWPADRAWCLAHDVDPHWMGLGASRDAVEELLAEPLLDAVPWDPAVAPPAYGGSSHPQTGMPLRYRD